MQLHSTAIPHAAEVVLVANDISGKPLMLHEAGCTPYWMVLMGAKRAPDPWQDIGRPAKLERKLQRKLLSC